MGLRGLALVLVFRVGIALTQVDLPYVSIPRVQAPALAFLALAAALGLDRLIARAHQALWPALVVVGVSMMWTIPALWQRTLPDEEEDLIQDAIAALPPPPGGLRQAHVHG